MDTILIIEDNGVLAEELAELFPDCDIRYAHSYISALDRWDDYGKDIKCIILDLQIPPTGLKDDEVKSYYPYFGMAFVNYLRKQSKSKSDDILKKVVIYSAYAEEIKHCAVNKPDEFLYTGGIVMIQKRYDSLSELEQVVKRIIQSKTDERE